MPQSRLTGLLLIVTGALTFLGTTNQLLPAVAFFPGLLVCALGCFVFLKANHEAMAEAERQRAERRNPVIKPRSADALADRQAATSGLALAGSEQRDGRMAAQAAAAQQVQDDELVLYEVDQAGANEPAVVGTLEDDAQGAAAGSAGEETNDPDFVVTTDVSFPLEIQQQGSLADQIAKLRRLADDKIISEEEFAVAKAKLLA
jgi:hypothetical protein